MTAKQNVYISLVGKDAISKTLKNVSGGLRRLRSGASAVGGALLKAGAAAATAAAAIAGGIIAATKAAANEEKGIRSLNAAIAANVKGRTDLAKVEEQVAAQQKKLAFSDGEIRASLQALLPFTKNTTKAFEAQSVAADLARAKNMDLETASRQIGLALNGNTRVLKQLGIELPKTAKKADILAAIQKKVAGQAEAYANSTEGQFTTLKNSFDDIVETLGAQFLPIANDVARWANSTLLPAIERALPAIIEFGKSFIAGAIALGKELLPVAQAFARFIFDSVVPALVSIGTVLKQDVLPAIGNFFGWLNENKEIIAFIAGSIVAAVVAFKAYTTAMMIVKTITTAYAAAQAALNLVMAANPIGLVALAIAALIGGLVAAYAASADFRKIVDGVFEALKPLAPFVGKVLATAFEVLTAPIRILITVLQIVFDLIGKVVKAIMDSPLGQVIGAVGGFIGDLLSGERAGGGPVSRNRAYLVGERGPEVFSPATAGRIIPNHRLAAPAMAASPAGGISGSDLRGALSGMTVVMDGNVVGSLIDTRLATRIRGARTSTRQ